MMSSRPEISTHATGAHPARNDARQRGSAPRGATPRTLAQRLPARFDPYVDGLFTYCLSVLCDHDAATEALADALALAERRGTRGPRSHDDHRAWFYALARWSCLRRLAEARRHRRAGRDRDLGAHKEAADRRAAGSLGTTPEPAEETEELRRRELAQLAWPEAAGTTPEQREALELAVRHQLAPREVAAVLGQDPTATRELLAAAACEVERTRAALAVVETGTCPGVARLTGDHQLVLSAALRRELVRHVDDCPRCRRTAERAVPGTWPGTSVTPAALPVLQAPRATLHTAMTHAARARGGSPRFDRRGFPMDPKDHAARRDRLRARAVTTTVVATVVAAPVFALWAAYRGPLTGEAADGRPATAREVQGTAPLGGEGAGGYENAGNASARPGARLPGKDGRTPDVSVEVIGVSTGAPGEGRLAVTARNDGTTTLITLTASGSSPVHWSATTGASWLYMSQSSGTLDPGASSTIRVYVDHLREPSGPWHAQVAVAPAGAVVSIDGHGATGPSEPGPTPTRTVPSDPSPTGPPPGPDPIPGDPTPTGTPTSSPSPSDPPASSPPPTDSGAPSPAS
ncbi:hypothetical protein N8I84_22820 [Streptomyces cynarae]|uniref:BACON domain-containing protein n=2 Tax=Streptomyces cynarae TaxID=2981134 RepID=A0ABY6E3H5_9ACTN|nr:hypothetical protein [Streptomyces cynarae]UXY21207.1 hypothetical protein N8I84_22820 [Streptomyces cynarae]